MTKVLKSPPKRGRPTTDQEDNAMRKRSYGFVFSDNIQDWTRSEIRNKQKQSDHERHKQKKAKREGKFLPPNPVGIGNFAK